MLLRRTALKGLAIAGLGQALTLPWSAAQAQTTYPSKPVRVLTPFPAGAGPDAAMRVIGEQLGRKWGQSVVIDNRPGGNGFIAISAFKNAADSHSLLLIDSSHATVHPLTYSQLPYDVQKDLQPIGMILRTPFFIAVAADSPYRSLEDIVAAAKAKPDTITYGSWFMGSPGHIGALRLQSLRGISMRHVPYKDFGQLYAAVANKDVDWALGSVASAGAMERGGKLRFIAVAARQRDPLYPNVPATGEMPNLADFEVSAWVGLFAPQAMQAATLSKVATDLREALDKSEVVERYKTMGYESPRLTPPEFAQLIQRETKGWESVIRSANLKFD